MLLILEPYTPKYEVPIFRINQSSPKRTLEIGMHMWPRDCFCQGLKVCFSWIPMVPTNSWTIYHNDLLLFVEGTLLVILLDILMIPSYQCTIFHVLGALLVNSTDHMVTFFWNVTSLVKLL
jgi:hypothetical protein